MATALPNRRDKTRAQRIRDFLMTGPSPSLPAPQDGTERLATNCRERFQYAQPLSDVFDLTLDYSEQHAPPSARAICRKRCLGVLISAH